MAVPGDESHYTNLALRLGLVSERDVAEALRSQEHLYRDTGARAAIAELLQKTGRLTREQHEHISSVLGIRGYHILGVLAKGAQGTVFQAERSGTAERVAIKMLADVCRQETASVGRFLREARFTTELRHANIVRAFEVGQSGNVLYLVLELVDGITVRALLERVRRLRAGIASRIAADTADGLEHMRQKGLVHRDIKPENIMVTTAGVTKICDLGLARLMDGFSPLTAPGTVVGSLRYISPEQIREEAVDTRTDVYALGAVLYAMVVGAAPFDGKTMNEILEKHLFVAPVDPAALVTDLPEGLSKIILKCLAKPREERYGTPAELAAALRPYVTPAAPAP